MVVDREPSGLSYFQGEVYDVAHRMDIASTSVRKESQENELEESKGEAQQQDEPKAPQVRSSRRIIKKPKRDLTPPPPSPPKKSKTPDVKNKRGPRKAWELWSTMETNLFYEAIKEYGRHFDHIYKHFVNKYRKTPSVHHKTKEQIRFFYYRAAKKAMKYIKYPPEISPRILEVYSLVNYGEFRKRGITTMNAKIGDKLNELVHTGSTVIRLKNKNVKLRTPVCKALLKLHQTQSDEQAASEDKCAVKLPSTVTIELYPKNSTAWTHVQMLSHNPRLRITMKPGRRLGSLFDYLDSKWKSPRQKAREKIEKVPEKSKHELVLQAEADATYSYYELQVAPQHHKGDFSLDTYIEQVKTNDECTMKHLAAKKKTRTQSTTVDGDDSKTSLTSSTTASVPLCSALMEGEAIAMDVDMAQKYIENNKPTSDDDTAENGLKTEENSTDIKEEKTSSNGAVSETDDVSTRDTRDEDKKKDDKVDPLQIAVASAKNMFLMYGLKNCPNGKSKSKSKSQAMPNEDKSPWILKLDERISLLRKGFNRKATEHLMVGDVCLLMGNTDKIRFQYEFVDPDPQPDILELGKMSSMLRRLVHVAKAEYGHLKQTPHPVMKEEKTATKEVQVNTLTVKDVLASVNSGSPANGKRQPSTPKQRNRKPPAPTTPTTPPSSSKPQGTEFDSPSAMIKAQQSLAAAVAGTSPTIQLPVNSKSPPKEHVSIAPSPFSPVSSVSAAAGDVVFKRPSSVPNRAVWPIVPRPESTEPTKPYEPLMRKKRPRTRKFVSVQQRPLMPRADTPTAPRLSAPAPTPAPANLVQFLLPGNHAPTTLANVVVMPPGIPTLAHRPPPTTKKPATVTVLDPMAKHACHQIINTPAGTVVRDDKLTLMTPQQQQTVIPAHGAVGGASLLSPSGVVVSSTAAQSTAAYSTTAYSTVAHNTAAYTTAAQITAAYSTAAQITAAYSTAVQNTAADSTAAYSTAAYTTAALNSISISIPAVTTASQTTLSTETNTLPPNAILSPIIAETQQETEQLVSMPTLDDENEEIPIPVTAENLVVSSAVQAVPSFGLINSLGSSSNEGEVKTSVTTASPLLSSTMLDISLSGPPEVDQGTDKLIDLALENSTQSFSGLLDGSTNDAAPIRQASKNSSTLEADCQWLNGDEFNLSSFLEPPTDNTHVAANFLESSSKDVPTNATPVVSNFLESPKLGPGSSFSSVAKDSPNVSTANFLGVVFSDSAAASLSSTAKTNLLEVSKDGTSFLQLSKDSGVVLHSAAKLSPHRPTGGSSQVLGMLGESSRDSLTGKFGDIDTHIHSVMNEASVDYMSKFADLVQQVKAKDAPPSDKNKTS